MRTLIAIATAALLAGCPAYANTAQTEPAAPDNDVVVIGDDGGGSVTEYQTQFFTIMATGHNKVAVAGKCYSACSMVLFTQFNFDICVTDYTVFGFHKAFALEPDGSVMRGPEQVEASDTIWDWWMRNLPPKVRDYLKDKHIPSASAGDPPSDMVVVPGSMFFPYCEQKTAGGK